MAPDIDFTFTLFFATTAILSQNIPYSFRPS